MRSFFLLLSTFSKDSFIKTLPSHSVLQRKLPINFNLDFVGKLSRLLKIFPNIASIFKKIYYYLSYCALNQCFFPMELTIFLKVTSRLCSSQSLPCGTTFQKAAEKGMILLISMPHD